MDERFRQHIAAGRTSAGEFSDFLAHIVNTVESAFKVSGEAGRVGSGYRDLALRSVQDATAALGRASQANGPAPFVFFACVQDAMSSVLMFASAADTAADDGYTAANLAVFGNTDTDTDTNGGGAPSGAAAERILAKSAAVAMQQQASEKFQQLFDTTASRVMAILEEALRQAQSGTSRAAAAQRALGEIDEVQRLLETAGNRTAGRRTMSADEMLNLIDDLEAAGRRIAAKIGVAF
ncbi:hypothetical protein [Asanoa ishikariensis]|nr:hypothetical protein [Asanoa ishikariensis]